MNAFETAVSGKTKQNKKPKSNLIIKMKSQKGSSLQEVKLFNQYEEYMKLQDWVERSKTYFC